MKYNLNFRQVAENLSLVVWITSQDWKELYYVNPAFEQVWGIPAQNLIQSPKSWIEAIHPEDRLIIQNLINIYKEKNFNYPEFPSFRIIQPSGETRWIKLRNFQYYDEETKNYKITVLAEDTTENKNTREEFKLLQPRSPSSETGTENNLNSELDHDFNNMLSNILGFSKLALEKIDNTNGQKLHDYLKEIEQAAFRAKIMFEQLQKNKMVETNLTYYSKVEPIIDNLLNRIKPEFPESFKTRTHIHCREPYVAMSPRDLSQVLINLYINAFQAMRDDGQVTIVVDSIKLSNKHCSSCKKLLDGEFVILSIEDEGTGISSEIFDKIFDEQFSTYFSENEKGIGLTTVHHLMHKYSGHIISDSILDQGTRIDLLFPKVDLSGSREPQH